MPRFAPGAGIAFAAPVAAYLPVVPSSRSRAGTHAAPTSRADEPNGSTRIEPDPPLSLPRSVCARDPMARVTSQSGTRPARPRSPRRGSTPTFSVVIVSRGDFAALESCVERLCGPCCRFGAELVIVAPLPEAEVALLRERLPDARIVVAPADLGENELRALGIHEAGGDIVAFTEDCDARGEEWLSVLERRARSDGAYGPTPNGATNWAQYLADRGLLRRNGHGA